MKVLKFGGTSVGTVESLANVKAIVEGIDEPVIVVVSALGGLTDKLIATANMAAAANDTYKEEYERIVTRHNDIISGVVPQHLQGEVHTIVDPLLKELGDVYLGISLLQDLSPRTLDRVVSFGERLSSVIISRMIEGAIHFNSPDFIYTDSRHGRHVLDDEESLPRIKEVFTSTTFTRAIVPGFIARDRKGRFTNLGRGGSDYTAAILAAALDAHTLEIWTDVDGFMTADPRILPDAHVIDRLSFVEAMELCNFGAKVIYPPTIYPVFHKGIPIYIKNTFRPWVPGTCISDAEGNRQHRHMSGVTSLKDIHVVTVSAVEGTELAAHRGRMVNLLSRNGVTIYNLVNDSAINSFRFAVRGADVDRALDTLNNEYAPELQTGEISGIEVSDSLTMIAIVGDNLQQSAEEMWRRVNAMLADNAIVPHALSEGSSATTLSFVVEKAQEHQALRLLHDMYLKF